MTFSIAEKILSCSKVDLGTFLAAYLRTLLDYYYFLETFNFALSLSTTLNLQTHQLFQLFCPLCWVSSLSLLLRNSSSFRHSRCFFLLFASLELVVSLDNLPLLKDKSCQEIPALKARIWIRTRLVYFSFLSKCEYSQLLSSLNPQEAIQRKHFFLGVLEEHIQKDLISTF